MLPVLFNFALDYYISKVKKMNRKGKNRGFGTERGTSTSGYANDGNLFRRSLKTMINSQLYMVMEGRS
jgi:hypothetical protein